MVSFYKKFCAEFVSNVQIMNMFFILKHETLKRAFVFSANELKPHKKRVWQSIKILVCFSFVLLLTSNNNKNNTVVPDDAEEQEITQKQMEVADYKSEFNHISISALKKQTNTTQLM